MELPNATANVIRLVPMRTMTTATQLLKATDYFVMLKEVVYITPIATATAIRPT